MQRRFGFRAIAFVVAVVLLGVGSGVVGPEPAGAAPPNDNYANATPLTLGVAGETNLMSATREAGEPWGATARTAWFTWTAPGSMPIRIETDCLLSVYRIVGPGLAGLQQAYPSIYYIGRPSVSLDLQVAGGDSLALQCWELNPVGDRSVKISTGARPANDALADAAALVPGTPVTGNYTWASVEPGEPLQNLFYSEPPLSDPTVWPQHGKSLWWTWTATSDTHLDWSDAGPNVAAYEVVGAGFAGLTPVGTTGGTDVVTGRTYAFQALFQPFTPGNQQAGSFTFTLLPGPHPANDDLADAAPVTLGVPTPPVAMRHAGLEPGEAALPGTGGSVKSLWWTWTAASATHVQVVASCSCVQGFEVSGAGIAGLVSRSPESPSPGRSFDLHAEAGTTYVFRALGGRSATSPASVDLFLPPPPPANDHLAGALPVQIGQNSNGGNPDGATLQPGEPGVSGFTKSVWWKWTASLSQMVTVLGGHGTRVYRVNGPGFTGLSLVSSDAVEAFPAVVGVTYAIQSLFWTGQTGIGSGGWGPRIQTLYSLAPSVSVAQPTNGAQLQVGDVVNASYACQDVSGWGVYGCQGSVPNGAPIETSTAGVKTFTVIGSDTFDNTNTRTVTYTVFDTIVEETLGAGGGLVTTDPGSTGPTTEQPIETSVASPNPGLVKILQGVPTTPTPLGFELLTKQVTITAPPATAEAPLTFIFDLDASLVPPGESKDTLSVLKDGALLANCLGATTLPPATGACVSGRDDGPSGGGSVRLTVISNSASRWNVAAGSPIPPVVNTVSLSLAEGHAGTKVFSFPVTLTAPSALPVTVAWTTANVTATAPSDYVGASGTLTFAPGQTAKTVSITAKGDTTLESTETFRLLLTNPSNATLGQGIGMATIVDDDTFRIQTTALAAATVGKAYAVRLVAMNGTAPYKWKKLTKLPKGLKLAAKTGVISGKPKAAGTYSVRVQVTDRKRPKPIRVATKTFVLSVR
jgi:hypothetical protein